MKGSVTYDAVAREGRATGYRKVFDLFLNGELIRESLANRLVVSLAAHRHHIRHGDQSLAVAVKGI